MRRWSHFVFLLCVAAASPFSGACGKSESQERFERAKEALTQPDQYKKRQQRELEEFKREVTEEIDAKHPHGFQPEREAGR